MVEEYRCHATELADLQKSDFEEPQEWKTADPNVVRTSDIITLEHSARTVPIRHSPKGRGADGGVPATLLFVQMIEKHQTRRRVEGTSLPLLASRGLSSTGFQGRPLVRTKAQRAATSSWRVLSRSSSSLDKKGTIQHLVGQILTRCRFGAS